MKLETPSIKIQIYYFQNCTIRDETASI